MKLHLAALAASYYTVVVDGKENAAAAWYYPSPSRAAAKTRGRVAFWRGVEIVRSDADESETAGASRGVLARLLGR